MDATSIAPVESWDVADVIPYEFNHKKHPPEQIEELARSIKGEGLNDPITVDKDGEIISGHGRYQAIKLLGWSKVPVRCLKDLSKPQAAKLRIAANKTTSTEYDVDMLARELRSLNEIGVELDGMGLSDKEMTTLLDDIGEVDLDLAVEDVTVAVERHEADVAESSKKADASRIPLSKAFGFKDIPLEKQKVVTRFLGVIEDAHGKEGLDALLAHMEDVLEAAA